MTRPAATAAVDGVAIERRTAGDRSVRLTTAERVELVSLWVASGRSVDECARVTGVKARRYAAEPSGLAETSPALAPVLAGRARLACQDPDAPDFTDAQPVEMWESATICATCPVAEACLNEALSLQRAHAAGTDPYGVSGCWAGWWFSPGRAPYRIRPADAPGLSAAANAA